MLVWPRNGRSPRCLDASRVQHQGPGPDLGRRDLARELAEVTLVSVKLLLAVNVDVLWLIKMCMVCCMVAGPLACAGAASCMPR